MSGRRPGRIGGVIYRGQRFPSWHAVRWARYFDALGVEWRREQRAYHLGDLGVFTPTLYLPALEAWVEVTSHEPNPREQWRMARLTQTYPGTLAIIRHQPPDELENTGHGWCRGRYEGQQVFVQCIDCGVIGSVAQWPDDAPVPDEIKRIAFFRLRHAPDCPHSTNFLGTDTPAIHAACKASHLVKGGTV